MMFTKLLEVEIFKTTKLKTKVKVLAQVLDKGGKAQGGEETLTTLSHKTSLEIETPEHSKKLNAEKINKIRTWNLNSLQKKLMYGTI